MKQKVLSKLIFIMLIIGILLTIFESYNFRKYGIETAIKKAEAVSEVVKNGLTSYMVNNNMHDRAIFLNAIAEMDNVEQLWVIRGENVTKQYGEADKLEIPRDDIDKNVLNNAKMQYTLNETIAKTTIRVTIPYKAEQNNIANCISCHDVKYGDTLGAVSIVMDISDIKNSGLKLAFTIILFTSLAIIMVIFFANRILKPHLETIDELSEKIKSISNGVFTNMITKKGLSTESENLIKEYNMLVNGLSTTFEDIDKKLSIFVGQNNKNSTNPLLNSQRVISNLSEIYQFKKEIELDHTKEEIYNRLAQILKNKFNLKQFTFMEQNLVENKTVVVYSTGENHCLKVIRDNPNLCRVAKSTTDVVSIKDHKVCANFCNDEKEYYCTSLDIGDQLTLTINFVLDNQSELNNLKSNIALIKNYFLEATPSIIVKTLLDALKASAFKDGLTGLYNRQFLDEHLTKLIPQTLRKNTNIGVLMLDMDHFKAVNDEYGHDIGDLVLNELARILTETVRESDIIVRYGGEEFIVLLVDVDSEESALEVANKIRTKVSENEINVYAGNRLRKTISSGLSMFPKDSKNFDVVMKNADIALYEAKNSGRNQVVRYKEKVDVELF